MTATKLRVRYLKADTLRPYRNNPRTHSAEQVAQIAASLQEFGWTSPILIDGERGVVAGHGRLLAAQQLGMAEVPVIELADLTEAQRRAYVIADNQIALNAGWDEDLLRVELAEIGGLDFDLGVLGFDDAWLDHLLAPPRARATADEDDGGPARSEIAITRIGDVWRLGGHRLMCGDSTARDPVAQLIDGELADVVFTDPPYGVNVKGGKSAAAGSRMRISGDLSQTAIPFSFDLAVEVATVGDARLYFCGEGNIALYGKLFDRHLGQMPRHLIWVKNGFTMKPNGYHNQYEIIFHGYKPGGGSLSKWFSGRTEDAASDVWQISRDAASTYVHPTQKPVALPLRAITNSAPPGGVVYEPFSGSGSTIIACEKSGRRCRAMEIDPGFVDVAIRRWQAYTGEDAVLEATGRRFVDCERAVHE